MQGLLATTDASHLKPQCWRRKLGPIAARPEAPLGTPQHHHRAPDTRRVASQPQLLAPPHTRLCGQRVRGGCGSSTSHPGRHCRKGRCRKDYQPLNGMQIDERMSRWSCKEGIPALAMHARNVAFDHASYTALTMLGVCRQHPLPTIQSHLCLKPAGAVKPPGNIHLHGPASEQQQQQQGNGTKKSDRTASTVHFVETAAASLHGQHHGMAASPPRSLKMVPCPAADWPTLPQHPQVPSPLPLSPTTHTNLKQQGRAGIQEGAGGLLAHPTLT